MNSGVGGGETNQETCSCVHRAHMHTQTISEKGCRKRKGSSQSTLIHVFQRDFWTDKAFSIKSHWKLYAHKMGDMAKNIF